MIIRIFDWKETKGERTKLSKKEDNFFLDPDPLGDIWYIKYDLFDSSSKF